MKTGIANLSVVDTYIPSESIADDEGRTYVWGERLVNKQSALFGRGHGNLDFCLKSLEGGDYSWREGYGPSELRESHEEEGIVKFKIFQAFLLLGGYAKQGKEEYQGPLLEAQRG